MDIQAYKYNLIEELTKIQDIKILEKISSFLKTENDIALSNAIDEALNDVKNGNIKSHEEVMESLRKSIT